MKQLNYLIALAALIVAFSACSKDDDDFNIVGTWNNGESSVGFYMNSVLVYEESEPADGTTTFHEDGTGTSVSSEGTTTFQWSLTGKTLSITEEGTTMALELTTMTNKKVVAAIDLTFEEFVAMFEDVNEEDLEGFEDMTIKISMELTR